MAGTVTSTSTRMYLWSQYCCICLSTSWNPISFPPQSVTWSLRISPVQSQTVSSATWVRSQARVLKTWKILVRPLPRSVLGTPTKFSMP